MTGYQWTVSSGGTITWGAGTNQIQVVWTTSGAQSVSVIYTNPFGCGITNPAVLPVTVNPFPANAGVITGLSTVCAGTLGVAYSVPIIANTVTYVWTLPSGVTIASGAGTNNITVDFAANTLSGTISVVGNNLCGNGTPSAKLVTVNPLPAPSGEITGSTSVCSGETEVAYSVALIAGATSYNWTLPPGASIASGEGTNTITVDFGTESGEITVIGLNDCGIGTTSPALPVNVNPIPETPVITADGYLLTSSAASGNQWYHNGIAVTGATQQTYEVPADQPGYYWNNVTLLGCTSDTSNHIYIVGVGIPGNMNGKFSIFPVPNHGRFTASISWPYDALFNITVYNGFGVVIYQKTDIKICGTTEEQIELLSIPSGVYTIVFTGDGCSAFRKIVVSD